MAFNLEAETIDGYQVSSETKRIWAVEMDLARHLLDVCNRHNLRIWATGGTLIGAVRHHGFIPWDDDMDFCMMRDDYDMLIEIGPSEFKEPYFFQSFYTDRFWGGMVKIRRSDTAMIPSHFKIREYNMGIFIDVFVLDAIPDDSKEFLSMYKKIKLFRKLLYNNCIAHPESLSFKGRINHMIISSVFKIVSPDALQKRIVNEFKKHPIQQNEECGLIDFSAQGRHSPSNISIRSSKHCYDGTLSMPFHNMTLPVPIGYDEILTRQYGDYMTPVKGGQFHSNILVDCSRPYSEVLAELKGKDSQRF